LIFIDKHFNMNEILTRNLKIRNGNTVFVTADSFQYSASASPAITSLSSNSGTLGDSLSITGTGFSDQQGI